MGYLHAINHSSAASHSPLRGRAEIAAICDILCQGVCHCLVRSEAQVRAPPAPAQERRAPTIGAGAPQPCSQQQWPCTDTPAAIRCCDCRPGADTTLLWSHDGGRTSKKINVSGVQARLPKSVFLQHRTREIQGMGPLESIRAFSDGYQGASIEHSLMDTRNWQKESIEHSLMDPQREGGAKCKAVCAAGNSHAWLARVVKISSHLF